MKEKFKEFDKITEMVLGVASVTEDLGEAKNLLDVYLTSNYKLDKVEIMEAYKERDSRFIGWNALEVIEVKNVDFRATGSTLRNAIFLGVPKVRDIELNNLKVKVVIEA